jgi:hypothetical protein
VSLLSGQPLRGVGTLWLLSPPQQCWPGPLVRHGSCPGHLEPAAAQPWRHLHKTPSMINNYIVCQSTLRQESPAVCTIALLDQALVTYPEWHWVCRSLQRWCPPLGCQALKRSSPFLVPVMQGHVPERAAGVHHLACGSTCAYGFGMSAKALYRMPSRAADTLSVDDKQSQARVQEQGSKSLAPLPSYLFKTSEICGCDGALSCSCLEYTGCCTPWLSSRCQGLRVQITQLQVTRGGEPTSSLPVPVNACSILPPIQGLCKRYTCCCRASYWLLPPLMQP